MNRWGKIWKVSKEELESFVKTSVSFAEVIRKIGYGSYSNNHYISLKDRLFQEKIEHSHFSGRFNRDNKRRKISLEEALKTYFIENSEIHQKTLREYILHYKLIESKCSKCNLGEVWNGEKLTLQLDHIDGRNKNNQISNLRWLCPNCHSQTKNWGAKNISSQK